LGLQRKPDQKICWLASYPKSGNTWTRLLLAHLLRDHDDHTEIDPVGSISSNRPTFDHITGLSSSDLTDDEVDLLRPEISRMIASNADKIEFIKTHDSYYDCGNGEPIFPLDCSYGAIYLVRNPLDIAVSYAYHQGHQDFAKVVRRMNCPTHSIAGGSHTQIRQKVSSWSGHYRSWHDQSDIPVLTIRYEDMVENTAGCLLEMATFIGLSGEGLPQRIKTAVEQTRFHKLQENEQSTGFKEKPERAARFFRSGRTGEGVESLDIDLQRALLKKHQQLMRELGYA